MQKLFKYLIAFMLLLIICYAFSASYSYDNIDNLAYVVAMGIDSSANNKIKVSFQFTDTSAFSGDGNNGEGSTIINSVDANSLESAINLINSYIGKNVNLAHCKVIIFSEEIAKNGISDYIYGLINNSQIRPTSNIVISRCNAQYYMENSISQYEKVITKYYEVFPNSSDYTGYISNVTLGDFFNQMQDAYTNPVAILGGINKKEINTTDNNSSDSEILANQSTIIGERGTENIGLAVFKDDKLVGELTASESLCHSIVTNEVDTFLISIPNPRDDKSKIDFSTNQYKKPKINIDVSNGSPYISIDIYLFCKILSIDTGTKYLNNDYLETIASSADNYLSYKLSEYLYKTSTEFKACIDNFDKYAVKKFMTSDNWKSYNWSLSYPDSFFNVHVHTKINSSLLLTES